MNGIKFQLCNDLEFANYREDESQAQVGLADKHFYWDARVEIEIMI